MTVGTLDALANQAGTTLIALRFLVIFTIMWMVVRILKEIWPDA